MNAWLWPAWNLDICLRVCPLRLRISCMSVCALECLWVPVCNVCLPVFLTFLHLTVFVCVHVCMRERERERGAGIS